MGIIKDFKAMLQFKKNPIIEIGPLRYEFYQEKVEGKEWSLSADGPDNDELCDKTWKHYGWKVSCIDKASSLEDLEMLDEINGFPVDDATECFKDCKNLISIKHIATPVLESYDKKQFPEIRLVYEGEYVKSYTTKNSEMFKDSGLQQIPEQLLHGKYAHCRAKMMQYADNIENHENELNQQGKDER